MKTQILLDNNNLIYFTFPFAPKINQIITIDKKDVNKRTWKYIIKHLIKYKYVSSKEIKKINWLELKIVMINWQIITLLGTIDTIACITVELIVAE